MSALSFECWQGIQKKHGAADETEQFIFLVLRLSALIKGCNNNC